MKNIVIFGAPGSGKGTQSDLLVQKYGFKHISTGDVLRAEIKQGTELGQTAQSYIDKGQLIPDSLMIDILAQKYDALCPCEGVIFDGFPRTIPQAKVLNAMLAERNAAVDAVVGLEVEEKDLVDRMLRRGKESGRADDNIDTIKKRLDVYHKQTSPLKDYYKNEGKYHAINGNGEVENIFGDIKKSLSKVIKK